MVFSEDETTIAAVIAASAKIVRERQSGMLQGGFENCPGQVLVLHIPSGSVRTLAVEYPAASLAFSPDGLELFAGPGTQYVLSPIPPTESVRAEVRQVLRSRPDSDRYAIRAYDVRSLKDIHRLDGHVIP